METKPELTRSSEPLNVLLVGNNPLDMSKTLEKINQIRGRKVITEIAFDVKSSLERLLRFNPNFILIDDNIGKTELAETVSALNRTRKTRNIPITVLKNSNYREASSSTHVLDYILKQNFSTESLYSVIRNSLKFMRTQAYLSKAYQKRKGQMRRLTLG
jgi:DNA-binding NarL/FixJ family response regulator